MELHTVEERGLVDLARLLLEDVCSDLVRFLHARDGTLTFGHVRVDREYALGHPGAFADLWVERATSRRTSWKPSTGSTDRPCWRTSGKVQRYLTV